MEKYPGRKLRRSDITHRADLLREMSDVLLDALDVLRAYRRQAEDDTCDAIVLDQWRFVVHEVQNLVGTDGEGLIDEALRFVDEHTTED